MKQATGGGTEGGSGSRPRRTETDGVQHQRVNIAENRTPEVERETPRVRERERERTGENESEWVGEGGRERNGTRG